MNLVCTSKNFVTQIMLKMKELCVKIDLRKVILISFHIFFILMFYFYKSVKCVFTHFLYKMYAYNKNICLKLRNVCFTKFIDSLKITFQIIKFALQFAKCKVRICTLPLIVTITNTINCFLTKIFMFITNYLNFSVKRVFYSPSWSVSKKCNQI